MARDDSVKVSGDAQRATASYAQIVQVEAIARIKKTMTEALASPPMASPPAATTAAADASPTSQLILGKEVADPQGPRPKRFAHGRIFDGLKKGHHQNPRLGIMSGSLGRMRLMDCRSKDVKNEGTTSWQLGRVTPAAAVTATLREVTLGSLLSRKAKVAKGPREAKTKR